MMKSTLIKDLYGEIERLKTEVYCAREKNGVYIQKERYYQEESEKKAMSDQIEQMGALIEAHQKKFEELQNKYDAQVQQCSDLSRNLEATQKNLNQTSKLLFSTTEDLKKCHYSLKEKDFIMSEQRKAENALAHQACVLRSDLEKALQDNAALFLKIAREDKLQSDNRSVVNQFQTELAQQIRSLGNALNASTSRQNEHLQSVEKLCQSFLDIHEKALIDMKKKVGASRALYVSHIEAVQNIVRLHTANSNASLEDISCLTSSNAHSIEEFLGTVTGEAKSIYDDLQSSLATHQEEMTDFIEEFHQRFHVSIENTKDMSEFTRGFICKLLEESEGIKYHSEKVTEDQMESIAEFQRAYEEQSKSDAEKLITDMTNLVSNHIRRQKELVDERLIGLRESVVGNKAFLDGHVSTMEGITTDAKRKWQDFSLQAENDAKDSADYSAAKHCRVEVLLQQCVNTAETAFKHWEKTHCAMNEMENKHVSDVVSLIKNATDDNEQHGVEIDSARAALVEDVAENHADVLRHVDCFSEQERESISGILETVEDHETTVKNLWNDHSSRAKSVEEKANETFQQRFMDYESLGTTPTRSEPDIPSKGTIDSLRAMPMESLIEEFRENHSYESFEVKELKPSLIPRSPLTQLN